MSIRNEKQELERRGTEVAGQSEKVEKDLNDMGGKIQRNVASKDAKLNNVKAVVGQEFEQSVEYMQILAEVEQRKN